MFCSVGISFTFFAIDTVCFCLGDGKLVCAIACLLFDDFCTICDGDDVSIIFGGDACLLCDGECTNIRFGGDVGIIIGCIAAATDATCAIGAVIGAVIGAGVTCAIGAVIGAATDTGLIIGLFAYVLGLVKLYFCFTRFTPEL